MARHLGMRQLLQLDGHAAQVGSSPAVGARHPLTRGWAVALSLSQSSTEPGLPAHAHTPARGPSSAELPCG